MLGMVSADRGRSQGGQRGKVLKHTAAGYGRLIQQAGFPFLGAGGDAAFEEVHERQ